MFKFNFKSNTSTNLNLHTNPNPTANSNLNLNPTLCFLISQRHCNVWTIVLRRSAREEGHGEVPPTPAMSSY